MVDIERQISKLQDDARILGLGVPAPGRLLSEARLLAAGRALSVLKIYLLRSSRRVADRLLVVHKPTRYPASHWTRGVVLGRSALSLGCQTELAGVKHLNRLPYVMAARNHRANVDEVLVNDDRGGPLEGTRSNLFWVRDGTLRTPRIDRCGVAGLVRERLLEHATRLGIPSRVRRGSWDDLRLAEEVFVCNSVVGVWPVRRCGAQRWRAPGPVTRQLAAALGHPRQVAA